MGGTNEKYSEDYLVFRTNYQNEELHKSKNLSPYRTLENKFKPSEKILEKTRHFLTKQDLLESVALTTQAIDLKHENMCTIKYHSQNKSKSICSEPSFIHTIATEFSFNNLKTFINHNKNLQIKKSEKNITSFNNIKLPAKIVEVEHMWYVLKILVEVCAHLIRYNIPVGELDPENVLITEEGEIKLLNCFFLEGFRDGLVKALSVQGYKSCFSPEELRCLKRFRVDQGIDREKSVVFSIGVVVLCVAVSEDFQGFYDFFGYEVNFKKILKRIYVLRNEGYPESFLELLVKMLDLEPGNRPDLKYLKNYIGRLINPKSKRGFSFFF